MKKHKPLTNQEGEVRELTKADFAAMRPIDEVLSPELTKIIKNRKRGERGLQKKPTKISVTIRLNHEIIQYFQSEGHGWQTRMNDALAMWVKRRPKRSKHSHKAA